MSLNDIAAFRAWLERENPSETARNVVARFLVELVDRSYAAPSVPIEALSDMPRYEVREADLPIIDGTRVYVLYRHRYDDDAVDIIDILQHEN